MRPICLVIALLFLAACSDGPDEDLQQFVQDAGKELKSKVEPLPDVKTYDPVSYAAFDLQDPFQPRKLDEEQKKGTSKGPDLTRRKELLESYPLDGLKFVGTLEQNKSSYALVRADQTVHRVKIGNHIGQNFGQIIGISETELTLRESIQDGEGEWREAETTLQLIDDSQQQQERKK
jgi:type IV pilus assembly protein PilP